jgi:hypothetical protein
MSAFMAPLGWLCVILGLTPVVRAIAVAVVEREQR